MPARRLEQLRLAWMDDFGGVPVSADTKTTLANLAAELARNGCRVERWDPKSFDFGTSWELWGELSAVFSGFPPDLESYKNAESPMMRGQANGLKLTLPEYQISLRKRGGLITALETFFEEWDALICPVVTVPAFPHCAREITPILVDQKPLDYWIATLSYTAPFNVTGHPVVVVPVGHSGEGLPIGVQVVGRRWGEMPLLATAKCIAQVVGPFQRPPGY
jgi:amidase